MLKKVVFMFVIFLLIMGCRREVQKTPSESAENKITGSYSMIENYEVAAGPLADFKGRSSYTIQVRDSSRERHIYLFENIANAYNIAGILSGDSIFLITQKFPYHNEKVMISGKGKLRGDSLFLDIFSGGPAGQIKSVCRAKKMYLK